MKSVRADGWYWVWEVPTEKRAVMYRLWTGTTGRQQAYWHGRIRLSARQRDQLMNTAMWMGVGHCASGSETEPSQY